LLLKQKVTENAVTNPLAAWLPFDQLNFLANLNIGECDTHALPIGTSLVRLVFQT